MLKSWFAKRIRIRAVVRVSSVPVSWAIGKQLVPFRYRAIPHQDLQLVKNEVLGYLGRGGAIEPGLHKRT